MSLGARRWIDDAAHRARRTLLRRHGGVAILLYHRVAALRQDPQQLAVSPDRFAGHLEVLAETCTPVRLREVPKLLRSQRIPRRAIAVTFDDGYADNLHAAKPLLERLGVPATVFVATGYVGVRQEFWWDELERLLLLPATSERAERVGCDGVEIAVASEWERTAAYERISALLRQAPLAQRDAWLRVLRAWAGEPAEGAVRADYLAVDPEELQRLDGGTVDVGDHSRHHLSLAAQPRAVQREEIAESVRQLREWLGRDVDLFSYPFGTPGADVDRLTRSIVRAAGPRIATINRPGAAHAATSRFALPRYLVRDWTQDRFADWLDREVFGW